MSKADDFIVDILIVCRKHNLSLGHEDSHGAFLIEPYKQSNIDWLGGAQTVEEVEDE